MEANRVIEAARECVGVPFRHQGRNLNGLDCIGLVRWPAFKLGMIDPGDDFLNYGREPQPHIMARELDKRLERAPLDDLRPTDILWFRIIQDPQHLALYTGKTIIHAVNGGPFRVVEHGFRHPWPKRLYRAYRYPDVEWQV